MHLAFAKVVYISMYVCKYTPTCMYAFMYTQTSQTSCTYAHKYVSIKFYLSYLSIVDVCIINDTHLLSAFRIIMTVEREQ